MMRNKSNRIDKNNMTIISKDCLDEVLDEELSKFIDNYNTYVSESHLSKKEIRKKGLWGTSQKKADTLWVMGFSIGGPAVSMTDFILIDNPVIDSLAIFVTIMCPVIGAMGIREMIQEKERILNNLNSVFPMLEINYPELTYIIEKYKNTKDPETIMFLEYKYKALRSQIINDNSNDVQKSVHSLKEKSFNPREIEESIKVFSEMKEQKEVI